MDMYLIWLVLTIVFVVIEAITVQLATIWFAIGALVATVLAVFEVSIFWQITAFILVSAITLALSKPIKKRFLDQKIISTNAQAMVGSEVIALQDFDPLVNEGRVISGSMDWAARSEEAVLKGDRLFVARIEGATLIVKH
ncbi:MAG: NfeD family protein [Erysipelotrichaceae bacterium]